MDFGAEPFSSEPASDRAGASVCVIVRTETLPGAEQDFARVISDLQRKVRSDEPDCLSYVVTRMMGSESHFAIHARFCNWRAFSRHAETAHVTDALPRLMALLAQPVSMEIFLEL